MAITVVNTILTNPLSGLSGLQNRQCRVKCKADAVIADAGQIRILLGRYNKGISISAMYVGHKGAGDYDFDGSQVQVFFGGAAGVTVSSADVWSDWVEYAVDETKDLVISFYLTSSGLPTHASTSTTRSFVFATSTGTDPSATLAGAVSGVYSQVVFVEGVEGIPAVIVYDRIQTLLDQQWGVYTDTLLTSLDQEWRLMSDRVIAELQQIWGLRLGGNFLQSWADTLIIKTAFSQPYNSAKITKSVLKEVWKDYTILKKVLQHSWYSLSSVNPVLKSIWSITNTSISNQLNTVYSIKNTDIVTPTLQQQHWSTGNTSVETLQSQYVTVDFETIYPVSIDLRTSIDQYAITASIVLANINEIKKFVPGNTVTVHGILDTTFTFIVDNYDYEMSFDADNDKVDLISPSALLDSPYCDLISGDYLGMASEICETLASPFSITWNILDWYIGDGILSASEETPLSVIRKIVNAVGGVIQSLPDGSITIISRYPKSCNVWNEQPPVYSINYSEDVISEQFTLENAPGYNSFSIQDDNTSSTLLRVEVEEIDSNSKTIKVFVYPDVEPLVSHSGNTGTVSLNYTGYITENVDEEVEFVSGESSVNGPISGINYSYWKYSDLGPVTYEPTGVLYSAVTGESLLDISYKTGYYSYTVSTSVLENIQIIVEADV